MMNDDEAALAVGYSSNDSVDSTAQRRRRGDHNTTNSSASYSSSKTTGRQQRQRQRRPPPPPPQASSSFHYKVVLLGEQGSTSRLIGTLLLIGIVFCLIDVLYIVRYVHERPVNPMPSSSSSSSSNNNNSNRPNAAAATAAKHAPAVIVLPTDTTTTTTTTTTKKKNEKGQIRLPDAALNDKGNNNNDAQSSSSASSLATPTMNDTKVSIDKEDNGDTKANKSKHDVRAERHRSNQDANDSKPIAAAAAADKTATTSVQSNKDKTDSNKSSANWNMTASTAGKEPLLQILQEAGVDIDDEIINKLPTWDQVTALYGEQPVVFGLDQCEKFQQQLGGDPADHFVSVAGTFNTGTNLMSELLIHNCHMPARMKKYGNKNRGVRWQVLWGKHTPVGDEQFRLTHRTYNESDLSPENIFPAVMIRDPFKWMQSMCRHPYAAKWYHNKTHCPNLVPNEMDRATFRALRDKDAVPVLVKYKMFDKMHSSLAGFWNDWYNEYVHAPFPRLIVRFEDVIFHPKEITKIACECAGGQLNSEDSFHYIVNSAKKGVAHGKHTTSYVDALIKYGTETDRYNGFELADLEYARLNLDSELMNLFGYKNAPAEAVPHKI